MVLGTEDDYDVVNNNNDDAGSKKQYDHVF
jgi:hypothetical protein